MKAIGTQLLETYPFNLLPTEKSSKINHDGIGDYGSVYLPSIDGDGQMFVWSQEQVLDYISEFVDVFAEDPIFIIDESKAWFEKCMVVNEVYLRKRIENEETIKAWIEVLRTAE